ncbi:MAG: hypothetical protein KGL38_06045 [Gemmatimonadota bacterium]|nr:hypothetical protein [Gemmatimonadota bacterium]MDE3127547.1 hypothetical protein [Gemmatimonadota bacterium]MDE3173855.1 hypothetical protein [Gemmatimonadota bacterium]MDE3216663.1 hypothetical protein [Gemmatimonadota bacterium]
MRGLAAAALVWAAACGSSSGGGAPTAPTSVSLAGSYTLRSFSESSHDLSSVASGTATLTDSAYRVNIQFLAGAAAAIVDSGTYTASSTGALSESSSVTGKQTTGNYLARSGVLTVSITAQGIPVVQVWQKH